MRFVARFNTWVNGMHLSMPSLVRGCQRDR